MEDYSKYSTDELLQLYKEHGVRQRGRTTRLIDYYIQQLFACNGAWIVIRDHCDLEIENSCNIKMSKELSHKIIKRLGFEHNIKSYPNCVNVETGTNDNGYPMLKLTMNRHSEKVLDSIKDELKKRDIEL